ncbi:unnamed protein product [Cylicocyclus nassatus]|uniref:RING-type domain-containing protein n=1 Tax=Cylicocyclus nassatus TaxID=53992 RepID=A0AA36GIH7_CYLNA|nr:unnamed protein product [Cylicocyclus nassatus]
MATTQNLSQLLEDLIQNAPTVLAVPITLIVSLFKIVTVLISIVTFPLRIAEVFARNFPILAGLMLGFFSLCAYIIKKITRQSVVSYFLYTVVPYCLSIVYTVFGVFFPQVHAITKLMQVLLHPIRFVLGIAEKVDDRARPIREVVEVLAPGTSRRADNFIRQRGTSPTRMSLSEKANNERIQCCICFYREKTVLLRPCNHICLCDTCLQAVMLDSQPHCPICRTPIESHIDVYL